jgi:hypothetical protein
MDLQQLQPYVVNVWLSREIFEIFLHLLRRNTEMKNTIVRSFVLALAVVGFSASSVYASSARTNVDKSTKLGMVCTPAPVCSPGSTCGIH